MLRPDHCSFICFIYVGFLNTLIGLYAVNCSVILSPSPATAIDGKSFTLTCTYSGSKEVAGFAWFLNGNTLAAILLPTCTPFDVPGPPDSSLFEYACLSNNQSSFTVKRISLKQNGDRWQCAAAAPGYVYSLDVAITVEVAVTNVSLQSISGSITEHIKTTFSCKTSPSKPAANITWYKESGGGQRQTITNEIFSTTEDVGDLQMSTSILKYSPNRSDNGYEIFCTAINIAGRTPITSAKFKMLVQYPPDDRPKIQDIANGTTYKVIENIESMLTCKIKGGNPLATLTWACFNNGFPSVINGTTVTKSVLWIATRGPDRSCTCQSSHPVTGIQIVLIYVHVLYKPDIPSFEVSGNEIDGFISFIEETPGSVVCESNGNPSPDIYSWTFKGYNVNTGNTLTFHPVRRQDDGQYTCTANNTMEPSIGDPQTGSRSSTVKINVLYGQKIIMSELDNKTILAGYNFNFSCPVTKGNPTSTSFKWTRESDNRTWNTQTLDIYNVAKKDGVKYTCTVLNVLTPSEGSGKTRTDSGSFDLNVLYMAVVSSFTIKESQIQDPLISAIVNESANVILECTVDSNPSSIIEINFKDKPLSKTDNARSLNYTLVDVSCLDTGVYTCTAENQYNSGKSSKMALTLVVRCSPRPVNQVNGNVSSALGHDITLMFKGLAYPIPRYTWMKRDGDQWRKLNNSSNAIISISGTDSNLTIRNVSLSDYGEYQLKIENEINYFIQPYLLSKEDVPDAPYEFQVVKEHISDTFALLRWKPGFSGGPKQIFVLLYKRPSEQDWKSETVEDTRESLMIYTIHKLVSDSVYTVVLLARNSAGDSVNSPNITFRTKETRKCEGKETNSAVSGGMIGGIIGGIVLCFVVVAVACFLFRRQIICSKGHLKKTPDKSITREHEYVDLKQTQNVNINPVYDDLQTDSENTEMTSNNIYVRPGTEDKESEKHVYTDLERQTEHSEENKMYANVKI